MANSTLPPRSIRALETVITHGSPAVALEPRRRAPAMPPPAPDDAVRVLDLRQIPLTSPRSHCVTVLVSGDEEMPLAMGVIGNLLGLTANGPSAGSSVEEQVIELIETPVFGRGRRRWFVCPGLPGRSCDSRRARLYLPPGQSYFACAECHAIEVPHAPGRALLWRGDRLRPRVLQWREPSELVSLRSA